MIEVEKATLLDDEGKPLPPPPLTEAEARTKELKELVAIVKSWQPSNLAAKVAPEASEPKDPEEQKRYWPGRINYASERGYHTGCVMKYFTTEGGLNKFCEENQKLLVVDIKPAFDGGLYVLYTNVLDPETQKEFDHFTMEVEGKMAEWRRAQQKSKENAYYEKIEALNELVRLAELGRKYEREVRPNLKAVKEEKKKGKRR